MGCPAEVILLPYQSLFLLAQEAQEGAPAGGGLAQLLFPLAIIMLLFYFMLIRPQRRKEDEFRRMVQNLKENDHVVTVGGIHGVVTNVQRDAERVTIRVDEATGTKLRVGTSAIARVVTDDDEGEGAAGVTSKK
jgi:preprotein translocase subunit YajC